MRYPVLSFSEVAQFPQIAARQSLTTINGILQAAPAPRFSGSDPVGPTVPPTRSTSFDDLLREWLNLDPNC
jgi:crotonobetainyl-CoA:carnitine CoA-transferase CaiB-like acyl-CoA transferase